MTYFIGGRGFGKTYRQIKSLLEVIKELEEENLALKKRLDRITLKEAYTLGRPPVALNPVLKDYYDEANRNIQRAQQERAAFVKRMTEQSPLVMNVADVVQERIINGDTRTPEEKLQDKLTIDRARAMRRTLKQRAAADGIPYIEDERAACANAPGSCECPWHVGFRERIKAQQDREGTEYIQEKFPDYVGFEAFPYPIPYLQKRKNNESDQSTG